MFKKLYFMINTPKYNFNWVNTPSFLTKLSFYLIIFEIQIIPQFIPQFLLRNSTSLCLLRHYKYDYSLILHIFGTKTVVFWAKSCVSRLKSYDFSQKWIFFVKNVVLTQFSTVKACPKLCAALCFSLFGPDHLWHIFAWTWALSSPTRNSAKNCNFGFKTELKRFLNWRFWRKFWYFVTFVREHHMLPQKWWFNKNDKFVMSHFRYSRMDNQKLNFCFSNLL